MKQVIHKLKTNIGESTIGALLGVATPLIGMIIGSYLLIDAKINKVAEAETQNETDIAVINTDIKYMKGGIQALIEINAEKDKTIKLKYPTFFNQNIVASTTREKYEQRN